MFPRFFISCYLLQNGKSGDFHHFLSVAIPQSILVHCESLLLS